MRFVESIFIGPQKYTYHITTNFLSQVCRFDAILFIRLYIDVEYIRRSFYWYCNTKMVWMIYSDLCSANSKSCKLLKHVSNGNITNSLKQKLVSPFIDSYLNWNVKSGMKILIKPNKGNMDINLKYELWKIYQLYLKYDKQQQIW